MGYRIKDEEIEQIKALDCLRHHYPHIANSAIHIANERKTSPFYGAILKKMGVRKGVSDLFFPKPQANYHGLWIEIKTLTGKPSIFQKEFIKNVKEDGYFACFAYGGQAVVDTVCEYFNLPNVEILIPIN